MKIYISFGQVHAHQIGNKLFHKDVLAEIECEDHAQGREIAFKYFGDKFFTSYDEDQLPEILPYCPDGIVKLI